MTRSAFDIVSACASVLATTKSTPCKPAVIILLTALPPAPPTPNTVMRGFSSRMSGMFRLIVMIASFSSRGRFPRQAPCGPPLTAAIFQLRICGPSEALAKPQSDASEIAARAHHQLPLAARLEVLEMRRLWINQETGSDRKGRALDHIGRSRNAERPADADLPAENPRRQIRQSGELAAAAGQNDMAARIGRQRAIGKPIAYHFQNFLDARLDDAHQCGARHQLRLVALVVAQRRHCDHVTFVGPSAHHTAIKRFDSLGVGHSGIEPPGDVHGDVMADERKTVGMYQ